MYRFCESVIFLLPLAILLIAAGEKPTGEFSEATTVLEVRVPVEVVANGEPVRGLNRNNFEIYDGRHRQKLESFDAIDLREVKSATPPPTVLPPAARRHFLLLFDLTYSEPFSILKARDAAMKLVHDRFNPSDLVGVATYSFSRGPQIALNFTSDRRQIDEAIRTLALPQLMPEPPDPLHLLLKSELPNQILGSGTPTSMTGMHQIAQAYYYNYLETILNQEQRANRQTEANEAISFAQSLSDTARSLAGVPGRKYVVYLSEGFGGNVLSGSEMSLQTRSYLEQGQTWKVDQQQTMGNGRVQDQVERMLDAFRRSDCVIEAVDIGGLRTGQSTESGRWASQTQRANGDATLFLMAHDTGGELFERYNDLGQAMQQMLDRTSEIYLLTFTPAHLKPDGSYHRIRVKLVGGPSGARVVARPGYYAPKPYLAMNAVERRLVNASLIVGGKEEGTLPVSILAAPFPLRGVDHRAYVPVLIEMKGRPLLSGVTQPDAIIQIYAYALDPEGQIDDYRVQELRVNLKKMGKAVDQMGLKFFGHLDLAPGRYSIRVLVRNAETGALALKAVPLNVPAFAEPAPVLLRPMFPEKPGKWLIVREVPKNQADRKVSYPFMLGSRPFIPAGRPRVAENATLPVFVVGYHLPKTGLALHAIVTRKGAAESLDQELVVTGTPEASSGAKGETIPANFKAQGLAPGTYELRVEATTSAGTAKSPPAAFVVTRG